MARGAVVRWWVRAGAPTRGATSRQHPPSRGCLTYLGGASTYRTTKPLVLRDSCACCSAAMASRPAKARAPARESCSRQALSADTGTSPSRKSDAKERKGGGALATALRLGGRPRFRLGAGALLWLVTLDVAVVAESEARYARFMAS